jgi:hypothetical protein
VAVLADRAPAIRQVFVEQGELPTLPTPPAKLARKRGPRVRPD